VTGTGQHVPILGTLKTQFMAQANYKMPPFSHLLLLLAYAMCFERQEAQLHLSVLLARNFTSSTLLSRRYIAILAKARLIIIHRSEVRLPLPQSNRLSSLSVNLPGFFYARGQELICKVRSHLKNDLLKGLVSSKQLEEVILEILVGDAVEYIEYYVRKNGKTLCGANLIDARLKVLLQTRSLGQVFMLLWRATKNLCKEVEVNQLKLLFEDVVKLAWEYNFQYQKQSSIVENYSRPEAVTISKVASILFYDLMGISGNTDNLIGAKAYITASKYSPKQKNFDTKNSAD